MCLFVLLLTHIYKTATFIDTIFELFSLIENVKLEEIHNFSDYVLREEFDSDSIREDMKELKKSNILNTFRSDELRRITYDHIQENICVYLNCLFFVTTFVVT